MSDSNRVQLRYRQEQTFGEMDTAGPMTIVENLQSESLAQTTDASAPDVIRADYVKPYVTRRSVSGGGSLNVFFSGVDLDPWLQGALRESIGAANSTTGSLTATAGSANFSLTGAFTNMVVGDFFTIAGSTSNDGVWQILTKNSNDDVDVVEYASKDQTVVTEGPTASVTIANGGTLTHGTTLMSWTLERQFLDLTDYIHRYIGQRVAGVNLSWALGQDTTAEVQFQGKAPSLETAVGGNGSTQAGPGNFIQNAIDHIVGVAIDGADMSSCAASWNLNLASPVRPRECIGSLGPQSVGGNAFDFGGAIELYNDDSVKARITNRYQFTSMSFSWAAVDEDGNGYGFYLPQVKLTAGEGQAGGTDQDVSVPLDFVCEADASGQLIRITKFVAP